MRLNPEQKDRLRDIAGRLDHFKERNKRARERLEVLGRNEWNFAIVGLRPDTPTVSLEGLACLRPVVEPPGEVELARALKEQTSFGAIGRYSYSIGHELAVSRHFAGEDVQPIWNFAWWLLSGIRIRTGVEFLVPAAADCSWSVVAAIDDNTCEAKLLEDVPQATRLYEQPVEVTEEDLRWAFRNALTLGDLLEVPRFRLAVEALTTHQHLLSPRMMAASIWSGIEALIGVDSELRFRLALSVASMLEPRGDTRYQLYCRIKKMYDVRLQSRPRRRVGGTEGSGTCHREPGTTF
jgi:hypothetical protein